MLRQKLQYWFLKFRPYILPASGLVLIAVLYLGQGYFEDNLPIFTTSGVKDQSQKRVPEKQSEIPPHSNPSSTEGELPPKRTTQTNPSSPSSPSSNTSIPAPQTQNSQTITSLTLPIRAAFYYGWYPEQWTDAGHRYNSTLGNYDSSNTSVIDTHIDEMKTGRIQAGIYSWWGQASTTDKRFASFLTEAKAKDFRWAIYYELDYNGQKSSSVLASDINYLKANYFNNPAYLYVDNKPVVFVYMPENGSCTQVSKWTGIRNQFNLYVSLMDVPEWWTCNTLDSWHGYKPDSYIKSVYVDKTVYSISVSAGFWADWESSPRLARDFTQWQNSVKAMVTYKPSWQLLYFNEFGEGTNIEPSNAQCNSANCYDYLNILNQVY